MCGGALLTEDLSLPFAGNTHSLVLVSYNVHFCMYMFIYTVYSTVHEFEFFLAFTNLLMVCIIICVCNIFNMVEELPVTDNSSDSEKADMRIVQAAAHEVSNLHHQTDKVNYIVHVNL